MFSSFYVNLQYYRKKRVRKIIKLKAEGKSVKDNRGRHISYVLSSDIKVKMQKHIDSFPYKISHCANQEIKYLHADLNFKAMFQLFIKENPNIISV